MTRYVQPSRRIELDLTEEIIARATARNSGHCVIADAVRAAMPDATRISVDLQTIRFSHPLTGRRYVYLTPAAAQHVLIDFDQGIDPTPQEIKLGRPIHSAPINRKRFERTGEQGRRRSSDDPLATSVELKSEGGSKTRHATKLNGEPPPKGALADPPKPQFKDNRRYAGQRRSFGLKMLRP